MSLATYRQAARDDRAANAEQARLNAAAEDERRAQREQARDERAARRRDQARADKVADRAARAGRREERAERRAEALTPERIYRTGTLALVVASGLASLPAQIAHFVGISPMLLPVPLGLEGTAWVMAAGVAYADARSVAVWVRWLLRALVAAAAGFAASINYGYGRHLDGLSPADATAAGVGLAAVTLLGPLVFEIRQWVSTLAAHDEGARDARRHTSRRRRHHRRVGRVAARLLSAAPHEHLTESDAWERAWEIVHGCDEPGMTPRLHRKEAKAADRLAKALTDTPTNAEEVPQEGVEGSGSDLQESGVPRRRWLRVRTRLIRRPRARVGSVDEPTRLGPDRRADAGSGGEGARPRRVTGRVPAGARDTRPKRTYDQLLTEARRVTADWSTDDLTADRLRTKLRTSAKNARGLRDTLRTDRAAKQASDEGVAA
ncbi:hypothetical protein [Streptomyces benahoarensis]|uniref:DUF2637 domain-containing protein n=1 Tax=Streptomyces benahoarensis TaxID=2595054 RepID=A0A553ZN48_9ACTN|nr:hypothetical protein [Streptomyces benahoarensis]TSB26117.1 hypothetical protein FNJ62_11560 [Streptomyces benahoarensis]TSB42891.1 hypothetical protein FNZ23_07425 [Streptomyces benahoarensis]